MGQRDSDGRVLRVWHIGTRDAMGGAARDIRRVHEGVLRLGVESRMLVLHKTVDDERIAKFAPRRNLLTRAYFRLWREVYRRQYEQHARTRRVAVQPFSDDRTTHRLDARNLSPRPDAVNLFWVAGFPDLRFFFQTCPAEVAVVWRLSDLNPFTGGCHLPMDCERWTQSCGACPELGSEVEDDLSRQIWRRKREAYGRHRIQVVAPSRWIAREAGRSALFGNQPITIIPSGVDVSTFALRDRMWARSALGLPQEKTIILVVADYLHFEWKGFRYLVEALRGLSRADALIVTVGGGDTGALDALEMQRLHLGRIQDDHRLARIYAAADLFVAPSVYDNLPNTVLEAMACGTPVAAFRTGGIPEVVRDGETGLLANWRDAEDLRTQVRRLLDDPEGRRRMGRAARQLIEREHTLDVEGRRFVELYREAGRARQR